MNGDAFQRFGKIGLAGAVAVGLVIAVSATIGSFADLAERRSDLQAKLDNLAKRPIDTVQLEADRQRLAGDPIASRGMFEGSDASQVIQQFVDRIKGISERTTGAAAELGTVETIASGSFSELVTTLEHASGPETIDALITELKRSIPVILVDKLQMRRATQGEGAPVLAISAIVKAYAAIKPEGRAP